MPTLSVESPISPASLIDQLRWRYATKVFDPARKIPAALWTALEEALVLAPSSFGLQPWKFFVVQNKAVREKLRPAAWNQSQITDASHLVVFAIKKNLNVEDVRKFIALTAKVRGVTVESLAPYQKMMEGFAAHPPLDINVWAARQVYIALGTFLTSAALLGVDACPMEGFAPGTFDEILGLDKKGYATVVVATAGYRSAEDKYAAAPKVRYEKSAVLEVLN
ncbi:MAG: NAD(P)H-dependent oxidoreductase [Elusimicrobia bacterium]|nr:NAD(P)H-dependent oxidoreductase [Elusimicrobiota bacterium]